MIRHLVSSHAGSALAVAVALALVQPAEAQNRRGWRSSGGQSGVPSEGYYPGGYNSGGYYPGGYQPGYGYQGQNGVYQGGYYQMPGSGQYVMPSGYTPGQNMMPQYGYNQQPNMMPQYGYNQQPNMMPQYGYNQQFGAMGTQPLGNAARVTVRLPADARLSIDDFQFQQTGPVRVLNTPELQPGQKYHYDLKAQWNENGQPVTQERTVNVQAGGESTVDFTQAAPKAAAEPVGAPADRPNPPAKTDAPPA